MRLRQRERKKLLTSASTDTQKRKVELSISSSSRERERKQSVMAAEKRVFLATGSDDGKGGEGRDEEEMGVARIYSTIWN